jgi:curved DNA-binding protein CbpA
MNPYIELDIPIDATDEEIKIRFRSLAQTHHPDKGGDEQIFVRIKLAYEILIDPIRRKEFDLLGESSEDLSIRNAALDHISQMMSRIIPTINPETDDPVEMMRNEVLKIKTDMHHNINVCNAHLDQLQKVNRRFNTKSKRKNLMLEIVEKQIEHRKNDLLGFEKNIKIADLILEILKDYYYGLEELELIAPS